MLLRKVQKLIIHQVLIQQIEQADPIIEFEAGIKLFNFGTKNKQDVDLVDVFTSDVRSV